MTPDLVAARLYALTPEEFTAARDAAAKQAKADGDVDLAKQVKALRKPSVGAWLVNLLATQETGLLEQLLSLGPALAEAQAQGQGDALRQLGAQRRELVGAVTSRAVALGDRPATAAVRDEVSGTLEAALSDPASADAVRSGRLVRALSYAGFGGVDLAGAVAVAAPAEAALPKPEAALPKAELAERRVELAAAEAAALDAAGRLDDLVRACERLEAARAAADAQVDQAQQQVDRAKEALRDAEETAAQAQEQRTRAEHAGDKAVEAVRDAQRVEEQARAALDRLRRA